MALEISNLGRRISGDIGFPRPQYNIGLEYYVDGVGGDDDNSGRTWDYAFKTIQAALNAHGALYDGANRKFDVIWVKPGVYAENLVGDLTNHNFFDCHIIGLGIRGTDSEAEIHPTTGRCFAGIANGLHLANLHFEVLEAVPIFDMEIFNNSLIEDCTFENNYDGAGAVGIDTDSCSHLTVRRCDFQTARTANPFSYAIQNRTGGWAHNCRYEHNNIFAKVAGILIENNCVNSQMVIKHNVIAVFAAGVPAGIGIDDNEGNSYCIDNWITALDAIDHAGGNAYLVANHVYTAGGGAVETVGTD